MTTALSRLGLVTAVALGIGWAVGEALFRRNWAALIAEEGTTG